MTPDERDRLLPCLQDLKAKDGRAALTAARATAT